MAASIKQFDLLVEKWIKAQQQSEHQRRPLIEELNKEISPLLTKLMLLFQSMEDQRLFWEAVYSKVFAESTPKCLPQKIPNQLYSTMVKLFPALKDSNVTCSFMTWECEFA